MIVNSDDICFVHILPRLNPTDLKFLYEVNAETRAMVKRSTRKRDLRRRVEISRMRSISTLEWACKNRSLWYQNQSRFCCPDATANKLLRKLVVLKWFEEGKPCVWDLFVTDWDASNGNVDMVRYCIENELDAPTCAEEACYGHIDVLKYLHEEVHVDVLKYLHEEVKAPWDPETASRAAKEGHLHILEYLVERKYDEYDTEVCVKAVEGGSLECLKYLIEVAEAPIDVSTCRAAAVEGGSLECLKYLIEVAEAPIDVSTCRAAAACGKLEILRYLHEEVKAPWDSTTAEEAAEYGHLHILEYLVERKYDHFKRSACAAAIWNGHLDCFKYLQARLPKRCRTEELY